MEEALEMVKNGWDFESRNTEASRGTYEERSEVSHTIQSHSEQRIGQFFPWDIWLWVELDKAAGVI